MNNIQSNITPITINWSEVFEVLGKIYWQMDYPKFLQILGWRDDDYTLQKFRQIQDTLRGLSNLDREAWFQLISAFCQAPKEHQCARTFESE